LPHDGPFFEVLDEEAKLRKKKKKGNEGRKEDGEGLVLIKGLVYGRA
jgi:hypothetical protein